MPPQHGLRGRDGALAQGRAALEQGRSVLVVGRPGIGKTAVARTLVGPRRRGSPHTLTGAPELADTPLAAAAMAGLLPPGGEGRDPGSRVASAIGALAAVAADGAGPVVLVEGVQHLDAYTLALLGGAARRGALRLVVPLMLGVAVPAVTALEVDDVLIRVELAPLSADDLRALGPTAAAATEVEQALAAADGSPLWYRQALRARWFGAPLPMPPLLREIADGQLDAFAPPVVDALTLAAVAGAVRPVTLAAAAGADVVRAAMDAELLDDAGEGLVGVANTFLRARLQERASLHEPALRERLRTAGVSSGDGADALEEAGPWPRADVLRTLVERHPHEVLDRLRAEPAELPDALALVAAEALLRTGDVAGATVVLTRLAEAADPEVRADAALALSYVLAHVHHDLGRARQVIDQVVPGLDRDRAVRVAARQVTVEAYHPHPDTDRLLEAWEAEGDLSAHTRLEVAKARSLVDWTHNSELPPDLCAEIPRLLEKVAAPAAERWASLAGVYWDRLFRDGFVPAFALVTEEVATARRSRDLCAVGSWWALGAGALGYAGHTRAALRWARRAVAALEPLDRFGVIAFPLSVLALAHARLGEPDQAAAALARGQAAVTAVNPLAAAVMAAVAAEVGAGAATPREAPGPDTGLGRQAMLWLLLTGTPTAGQHLPLPPGRPADGVVDRWNRLAALQGTDRLVAARGLASLGFPALALRAVRDAGWSTRPVPEQVHAQHLQQVLADVVHPGRPVEDGLVSARQMDVATLAATGLTDREVAARLHLSVRTVSNHLSRLYRDTGIGGREALSTLLAPVRMWQPPGG